MLAWWAASIVGRTFGIPISAGVLGLLAVLALLFSGVLKANSLEGGATWLLDEIVLFFIPCVVSVVDYFDLLRQQGVQLVLAVGAGTVLVMASTALAVHLGCRVEAWIACLRDKSGCAVKAERP